MIIEHLTIHSLKGLQAEYVFILNNSSGKYGFPSNIADDKVLELLLHNQEGFEIEVEKQKATEKLVMKVTIAIGIFVTVTW